MIFGPMKYNGKVWKTRREIGTIKNYIIIHYGYDYKDRGALLLIKFFRHRHKKNIIV